MKAKVYVQGTALNAQTASIFHFHKDYKIVRTLDEADVVVWTGGEDINPYIYGEKPLPQTHFTRRDVGDLRAVEQALEGDKFLVGICRGAQLLNCIPNGGTLWQDVDNHAGCIHKAFDNLTGSYVRVNSLHHQALRVTDKAEIIAWATESTLKKSEKDTWIRSNDPGIPPEKDRDIEAVWYPETKSLLVQWHPEFGHKESTEYFFRLMDAYYWNRSVKEKVA